MREGFIVKAEFDEKGYGKTINMTGRARVDTAGRTRHGMMYWSVEYRLECRTAVMHGLCSVGAPVVPPRK